MSLHHWIRATFLCALLAPFLGAMASAQEPPAWKMDALHLKNGARIEGLLIETTSAGYRFRQVIRKSGSPTITGTEDYSTAEVESVEALKDAERAELIRKLADLDKQRQLFLASLKQLDQGGPPSAIEGLILKPVFWPENAQSKESDPNGWAFDSKYFELRTNLREPLAVLMALQLEEIFGACAHVIPARISGKPTSILVWSDRAGFIQATAKRNASLAHPAVFDPATNRIMAGTELAQFEAEGISIRNYHVGQLALLSQRETEISKAMGGRIPAEFQDLFAKSRREIREAEARNDRTIRQARQHLLQVLNHEAIHAYLINWVFPPTTQPLPRWLNEGLAQAFETAFIEAGELRADWPDPKRLAAVRNLLAVNHFPSLKRTLSTAPDHFLVLTAQAAAERESSREAYLSSWILTYYLLFEKRLLPGSKLDEYLTELAASRDPIGAFEKWTGEPLDRFELGLRQWIGKLRPDGTSASETPPPPR